MIQRVFRSHRTGPLWKALAVTLIVVVALAVVSQRTAGQEGTTWELGNFCVDDYKPGSVCTANDVLITNISPSVQEACTAVGDTATALFTLELQTNATTRYDIGLFVATDGGSAQTGDSCYHDFLQPASTTGPWDFLGGAGPYREFDPDTCADTLQNDGLVYYTFQQAITLLCTDNDNDGVVDDFSTCTSWDNVSKVDCLSVKGAYPNTKAKCRCDTVPLGPPVLIYRGYDWGDLPDTYQTYKASGGAHHAIQDPDNDGATETQGGIPAVWLGTYVDFSPLGESDGIPSTSATGDDLYAPVDDEDGVQPLGTPWSWGTDGGQVSVSVNTSEGTCEGCKLGFWIDWNNDGDFGDSGESYLENVVQGTQTLTFDIPDPALLTNIYARFRLYDGNYTGDYLPSGLVVNGEVEDYYFGSPTAVELLSFTATGAQRSVTLQWETASEVDNLGFNVYRAEKVDGPRTKVNEGLIISLVPPGSPFGAVYEYTDENLRRQTTYFYWLQDLDIYGQLGWSEPIEVTTTKK